MPNVPVRHFPVYSIGLFLRKCSAGRLLTVAGAAALDVHMVCVAFVVGIVDALHRLAVDADGRTGMNHGTLEGIHPFPLRSKALTAGPVTVAGPFSANHDVALAAQVLVIVGAIIHRTF